MATEQTLGPFGKRANSRNLITVPALCLLLSTSPLQSFSTSLQKSEHNHIAMPLIAYRKRLLVEVLARVTWLLALSPCYRNHIQFLILPSH